MKLSSKPLRDRTEIEHALTQLEIVLASPRPPWVNDSVPTAFEGIVRVLHWVLLDPSDFGELIEKLDATIEYFARLKKEEGE